LMDAVTALSGSGPAYVFLLAESMARGGAAAGLPAALADRLARVTVAGAGELLHRSPLDPAILRQNVTSPGGTTAAALDVLMAEGGLERLMAAAIAAATKRSRDLAGGGAGAPWNLARWAPRLVPRGRSVQELGHGSQSPAQVSPTACSAQQAGARAHHRRLHGAARRKVVRAYWVCRDRHSSRRLSL